MEELSVPTVPPACDLLSSYHSAGGGLDTGDVTRWRNDRLVMVTQLLKMSEYGNFGDNHVCLWYHTPLP